MYFFLMCVMKYLIQEADFFSRHFTLLFCFFFFLSSCVGIVLNDHNSNYYFIIQTKNFYV